MKRKFSRDRNEVSNILDILDGILNVKEDVDIDKVNKVVEMFSEHTGNDYLDERGSEFKNLLSDSRYARVLSKLHDYCSDDLCSSCSLSKYCNHYINKETSTYDQNSPKMIDLFCGAGGLSLGFVQNGFVVSLANDIEPCCVDTYAHNHPNVPRENIILGDVNEVIANIKSLMRFDEVDLVVGGPPCQGFSMANRQRIIDDPRNKLYKSYVRVLSIVKPQFFVMENVKGMMSVSSQVLEDFRRIGYTVECRILNAKDFGVPQNRERLIFIGNRLNIDNGKIFDDIMKESAAIPNFVLDDALYGLRPLKAMRQRNATEMDTVESGKKIDVNNCENNEYLNLINMGKKSALTFNHKARYNNDRDIEIYGRMNPGDKSDDPKIADIMPYKNRNGIFKDKYYKLEGDKICKTITAHMKYDCNMYIHPGQARGLTPREAARVQSYPDDYFFRGPYTKTYMQIGNSVPPLLSRTIAKVIKKYIKAGE